MNQQQRRRRASEIRHAQDKRRRDAKVIPMDEFEKNWKRVTGGRAPDVLVEQDNRGDFPHHVTVAQTEYASGVSLLAMLAICVGAVFLLGAVVVFVLVLR